MAYIDVDKFAEKICDFQVIDEDCANKMIWLLHTFPTADVEEVRHGEWIKYPSDAYMKCSVCGMEYPKEKMPNIVGYCPNPNCGAKMDGGNE